MIKFQVSDSRFGLGVFAMVPIEPGEFILYVAGKLINFASSRLPGGEYAVQIGRDTYIDPIYPSRFLNHSCSPNAGLVDDIRLVALRQIIPGEEICFDYSTSMLERHWELECQCASPGCRGTIQDFDLLPSTLRNRYLSLGVVQSFILTETVPAEQRGAPINSGSLTI